MVYLQPDRVSNNWNLWYINSAQNKQRSQNNPPVRAINIDSRDAGLRELKDKLLADCLKVHNDPLETRCKFPQIMLDYIGFKIYTYPAGFLSPDFLDILESLSGESRMLNRTELRDRIDALSWLESNILKKSLNALQGVDKVDADEDARPRVSDCLQVYNYPLMTRNKLPEMLEYYTAPHPVDFSSAFQAIIGSLSGESRPLSSNELRDRINALSWLESDLLRMLLNDLQNDVKISVSKK